MFPVFCLWSSKEHQEQKIGDMIGWHKSDEERPSGKNKCGKETGLDDRFSRTELLIGQEALARLKASRVAVFGIGGVGGYVCEALVRSGIGSLDLTDSDTISITNLNRQIIATEQTIGRYKTEVMKERALGINPEILITENRTFFLPENAGHLTFSSFVDVVDDVDTVTSKIAIVMKAKEAGVPVISAMGAGNKLDPGRFRIDDLYHTRVCPLARVMRRELRKRGVESLKVLYSDEPPVITREGAPGSIACVPAAAGLMIAAEVVKDLTLKRDNE